MESIKTSLEAHGFAMKDVVKCIVMLAAMGEWGAFNVCTRATSPTALLRRDPDPATLGRGAFLLPTTRCLHRACTHRGSVDGCAGPAGTRRRRPAPVTNSDGRARPARPLVDAGGRTVRTVAGVGAYRHGDGSKR